MVERVWTDSERVMCLKKIEELQTDYQEMTENLTSSVAVGAGAAAEA